MVIIMPLLKANKPIVCFNSCILISVYPLDIPSIKKLQFIVLIDKN